jgi:uncharacterized membrane protein
MTSGAPHRARGSVLMLMPAAVLVVVVLGSIAVDFAIVFLGEREAASLAAAAANDAATAVAEQEFREEGTFRLDEDRARRVAEATLDASSSVIDDLDYEVEVGTVAGEPAVTVTVSGTVAYVFAPALPGAPDRAPVEASATAVARAG